MKFDFVLVTLLASVLLVPTNPARAQMSPQQIFTVGAVDDPCKSVEPLPEEVTAFIAQMAEAKKNGTPPPVPSADGMLRFQQYQLRVLLQDFGGNCHYATGNKALSESAKNRVIFFGDSITEFWDVQDPNFFANGRIDRGVSGQTTEQMLIRFRQDVLDLHPGVVHILAGINDIAGNTGPTSLERIEGNISSMVEQAEAHHIRVVLGSLLPANVIPWRPQIPPADNVAALNGWIKSYAAQKHLVFVDYYDALKDEQRGLPKKYSEDGVHPTLAGYQVMEPLTRQALLKAGAEF